LLLAILGFSLSLIGTFLVRSGVLSSVHAFASDPTRGVYILMMLVVAIGGALALFAWRAPQLQGGTAFEAVSKESALLLNNVLLTAAAATVFIGTLYPLLLDALTGQKISVGPPYFAITFAPIFVVLIAIVPFGPRLGWRNGDWRTALRVLAPALGIAVVAMIAVLAFVTPRSLVAAMAFGLGAWTIAAAVIDLMKRGNIRALPIGAFASALAHLGLGITLLGITGTTVWRSEALDLLKPGATMPIAGYTLRLEGVQLLQGPNYEAERATVSVIADNHIIAVMSPEKRAYPVEGQATAVTAIRTTGFSDLYLALGDERDGGWIIRAYVSPLAPFIWFGGAFMAFGGMAGLWGRLRPRRVPQTKLAAAE
jgi:cytochrome c-type biogenesis protein CcmF